VHGGTGAHASVNVVKMVWYCYSCHAKGAVDSSRIPTADELLAMLEPEKACREFPESYLALFDHGGYWADRFPLWLCWLLGMGEDPWTGEGTYPVHTPRGRLAGVSRRAAMPGPGPKYKYPHGWSASRTLFGTNGRWPRTEVLSINEGAADAASIMEVGVQAVATYGAGLHHPQVELIAAMQPRLILLGYDQDEAGEAATAQAYDALCDLVEIGFLDWKTAKDPAELDPEHRLEAVLEAVRASSYGSQAADVAEHAEALVTKAQKLYVEESA
jgi:hypothetical protein